MRPPEADGDLSVEALGAAMPGRPVRTHAAVVSTEAVALAWAREGAPHGALVTAGFQLAARGRDGRTWDVDPERAVGLSLVVRPSPPAEREGWLYVVASVAVAEVLGAEARAEWPDRVGEAAASVESLPGGGGAGASVVSLAVPAAGGSRAERIAGIAEALERTEERGRGQPDEVLDRYRARCRTLGREVEATLQPAGPGSPRIRGRADDVRSDGSLVVATASGRVAIRPQHLGALVHP